MKTEIATLDELLAHAHALENEAAERYEDLAAQMEVHNNPELAELFHKMAGLERNHVRKVESLTVTLHADPPRLAPWNYRWNRPEAPETLPIGQGHYRMSPHQAISLMIACEEGAEAFFGDIARSHPDPVLRDIAVKMAEEEKQHAEILREWQTRYPAPAEDWKIDLDEPVSQE